MHEFLMHRVELKVTLPRVRIQGRGRFLMHRVELKESLLIATSIIVSSS